MEVDSIESTVRAGAAGVVGYDRPPLYAVCCLLLHRLPQLLQTPGPGGANTGDRHAEAARDLLVGGAIFDIVEQLDEGAAAVGKGIDGLAELLLALELDVLVLGQRPVVDDLEGG